VNKPAGRLLRQPDGPALDSGCMDYGNNGKMFGIAGGRSKSRIGAAWIITETKNLEVISGRLGGIVNMQRQVHSQVRASVVSGSGLQRFAQEVRSVAKAPLLS